MELTYRPRPELAQGGEVPAISLALEGSCGALVVLHFWSPNLDPEHGRNGLHPERYVLRLADGQGFLAIGMDGQSLVVVSTAAEAHHFHVHEAAVRAAKELNAEGRGPLDVMKLEGAP